ncbi:MAG: hypothetical protein QNJ97_01405 [Myxococcota bacterium]|nr:hypothetical protein [Myxococcota bacterium]
MGFSHALGKCFVSLVAICAWGCNDTSDQAASDTSTGDTSSVGDVDAGADTSSDTSTSGDTETSSDSDIDSETGTDTTADTETETETETETGTSTDTDECEEIDWGDSCDVGEAVANWSFFAYVMPLMSEQKLTLDHLRCPGYKSAVVVRADTSCTTCPAWISELAAVAEAINQANGAIVGIWTLDSQSYDTHQAFIAFKDAGLIPNYVSGTHTTPPQQCFDAEPVYPFTAVIDLYTAQMVGKADQLGSELSVEEILNLVEQLNI